LQTVEYGSSPARPSSSLVSSVSHTKKSHCSFAISARKHSVPCVNLYVKPGKLRKIRRTARQPHTVAVSLYFSRGLRGVRLKTNCAYTRAAFPPASSVFFGGKDPFLPGRAIGRVVRRVRRPRRGWTLDADGGGDATGANRCGTGRWCQVRLSRTCDCGFAAVGGDGGRWRFTPPAGEGGGNNCGFAAVDGRQAERGGVDAWAYLIDGDGDVQGVSDRCQAKVAGQWGSQGHSKRICRGVKDTRRAASCPIPSRTTRQRLK
jgi:hypothetical protein